MDEQKIKKEATEVKRLSSVFSSQAVFVAKKSKEKAVDGVPILLESELPEIDSAKELGKFLEEEARKMFNQEPPKKNAEGAAIDRSSFLESAALKDRLKTPFSCLLSYFLTYSRKLYRFSIQRKA